MDINKLLAEADPAGDISIPGADWPAARRALGQMITSAPTPPRRRRGRRKQARRPIMVAAASAGIAAGLTIALATASAAPPSIRQAPGGKTGSLSAPSSFGRPNTASGVLHNAALAALQLPDRTPRPDQFVYMKLYTTDTTRSGGPGVIQQWTSVSGARFGLIKGGWEMPARGDQISACVNSRLKLAPGAPGGLVGGSHCVQAQIAGYLPNLPTGDLAELRHYLNTVFQFGSYSSDVNSSQLLWLIEHIMTSDYLTPAQQAAMYNLLAGTLGLKVVPHVRNQLGSTGVGVRTTFLDKGLYDTMIFDPKTYAPLGVIYRLPPGQKPGGVENGGEVLLKQAIVNKAGQLP